MIQWLRSLVFVGVIYFMMIPVGLIYAIPAIRSRDGALAGCKAWCVVVRALAPWMVGLKFEVRGTPPSEECIVAGKHQSFLDIILIFHSLPRGKFIMKKSLMRAPILGWYAKRLNCIPVDRGKRAEAVRKMIADVASGHADPGQLIIYPQGTRIAPGVKAPYKVGTYVLYKESGQRVYPVAANVGVFWPKGGIIRRPGTAVIEFLPPIEPGLSEADFMARLEHDIETNSNRLMREAGFTEIEE